MKYVHAITATAADMVKNPAKYRKGYVVIGVGTAGVVAQLLGANSLLYHIVEAVLTLTGVVATTNDK